MEELPDHDEVASAPKIIVDDFDNGPSRMRTGDSSVGSGGCLWWVGGIIAMKVIVAVIAFSAKQQPKPPQINYSYDRDGGFVTRYTHDIEEFPLAGFDPAGEPVLKIGNDAKIRLVFEFMPPSYVDDPAELGSFSDFDQQIADATGAKVTREDRNTFLLVANAETLVDVMHFIQNYPRPEPVAGVRRTADEAMVASVCRLTADLLGVEQDDVQPSTSLGDLGADDLDAVELVMELEEQFDVLIPDNSLNHSFAKGDRWDFSKTTMSELADIVEQQK